jgi:hypothetical protein
MHKSQADGRLTMQQPAVPHAATGGDLCAWRRRTTRAVVGKHAIAGGCVAADNTPQDYVAVAAAGVAYLGTAHQHCSCCVDEAKHSCKADTLCNMPTVSSAATRQHQNTTRCCTTDACRLERHQLSSCLRSTATKQSWSDNVHTASVRASAAAVADVGCTHLVLKGCVGSTSAWPVCRQ